MSANSSYFVGDQLKHTYLEARGFNASNGFRSGGIKSPQQVTVPSGSVLLRTYQDPARLFGGWWFTAFEISQVIDYFGRSGVAFTEGRTVGKGILQATLAVRHEWGDYSPGHLGLVAAVRTVEPLQAFFGIGDAAPDRTQKSNLKPVMIIGASGLQRGVRQLFLPASYTYSKAFAVLEREGDTDTDLIRMARNFGSTPLPFET